MSWRRITDATIDDAGIPYFAGDLPDRDNVVFALAPNMTSPRWLVDTPVYSASLAYARGKNELVVYQESLHQAARLGCADGAKIALIGGGPSKGVALDFRGADAVAVDAQGALIALIENRLRRFTVDGAELPPWPGATPAPPNDDKSFWDVGDRPTAFKTDGTHANVDRNGALYLFGGIVPCVLAKYDPSGKRLQKLQLPYRGLYPLAAPFIDGSGRVYLFLRMSIDNDADLDADKQQVVLRVSPDFSKIERLVESDDDRASLNERFCVALDGTLYIAGPNGGLHVFAADGSPRYSTHADPNEAPPYHKGENANAPVAVGKLRGKVRSAERDEADDPDLWQILTYFGVIAAIPLAFYFLGKMQGQDGGAAAGCGLTAGFFAAPAIVGWFGRRGLRFVRIGVVGRSICGVLAAIPIALFLLVFVGVDPLNMGYYPASDDTHEGDAPKNSKTPKTPPPKKKSHH